MPAQRLRTPIPLILIPLIDGLPSLAKAGNPIGNPVGTGSLNGFTTHPGESLRRWQCGERGSSETEIRGGGSDATQVGAPPIRGSLGGAPPLWGGGAGATSGGLVGSGPAQLL